jgi:hypothetical protein
VTPQPSTAVADVRASFSLPSYCGLAAPLIEAGRGFPAREPCDVSNPRAGVEAWTRLLGNSSLAPCRVRT